ncbi:MAG: formate/nitrite transporter family protein [Clostridia bacterium]|nr:formate/nitrite transporter family protein [Clostridia bacterium]
MIRKQLILGTLAGILISIGGAVFLASDNKYMGAILFTVALLCICFRGYGLYTGKIGFLVKAHGKEDISATFMALLGNFIGTLLCGLAVRFAIPALGDKAFEICSQKLLQTFPSTLFRGIFCGILMYLAVVIYRENKNIAGILFCVPVFIISGFEHSIADLFYFSASGIVSIQATGFLWTVILGNTVGGMLLPALMLIGGKEKKSGEQ